MHIVTDFNGGILDLKSSYVLRNDGIIIKIQIWV